MHEAPKKRIRRFVWSVRALEVILISMLEILFLWFELAVQIAHADLFMQNMRLNTLQCQAVTDELQSSYRSHARVGHWVSTSVRLASWLWIRLLSAAPYWTINSWHYLTAPGTVLNSILSDLRAGWDHSDVGNRSSVSTGTDGHGWTRLWLRRLQSPQRSRLLDSSCSHKRALWRTGRWDLVIRTWEPSNQVFDAARSLQIWTASQAHWSPISGSPGLLGLFSGGGLQRAKRWLRGRRLGRVLKEVNTITDPKKLLHKCPSNKCVWLLEAEITDSVNAMQPYNEDIQLYYLFDSFIFKIKITFC